MRSRLLVLAAAAVSLAAPLSAQTIFTASGGPVVFTPTSMSFTPFQLFADYLGLHRLIASSDGTIFDLDTRGAVAISSFNTLGPLTIATLSPGASIFFTYVVNGRSYTSDDFYRQVTTTLFRLDYADINNPVNPSSDRLLFDLSGVSGASGLQCPGGDRLAFCSTLTPVTPTPEPGTWALMATGLAGLIPVVRRRRSVSPS